MEIKSAVKDYFGKDTYENDIIHYPRMHLRDIHGNQIYPSVRWECVTYLEYSKLDSNPNFVLDSMLLHREAIEGDYVIVATPYDMANKIVTFGIVEEVCQNWLKIQGFLFSLDRTIYHFLTVNPPTEFKALWELSQP